jgi:hypothetical protein
MQASGGRRERVPVLRELRKWRVQWFCVSVQPAISLTGAKLAAWDSEAGRAEVMRILIGYFMRSGSTLLQHVLNEHSRIRSFSDFNSLFLLPALFLGFRPAYPVCVKPLDLFYLFECRPFYRHFDKFVWMARDPRDAYLSAFEAKYAYLLWLPWKRERGIDLGLLWRWKRTYRHYFEHADRWHLVRYEDLVARPNATLEGLFRYLEVPFEEVLPFSDFQWFGSGGDHKLKRTSTIHDRSLGRHSRQMPDRQQRVFERHLGQEMRWLGYLD